jgi:hypothetical protein
MRKYPIFIIFLFISLNIFADNDIIGKWYHYFPFSAEIIILENLDFTIYARSPVGNGHINGTLTKINDDNYFSFLSNDEKKCLIVLRYRERTYELGKDVVEVEMFGDRMDNTDTVFYSGRYSKESMSEEEYIQVLENDLFMNFYHPNPEQIFKELLKEDYKYFLEIFCFSARQSYMDNYITMENDHNEWYNGILKIVFENKEISQIYILMTDRRNNTNVLKYYTNIDSSNGIIDEFKEWKYYDESNMVLIGGA